MDKVLDETKEFVSKIKESEIYKDYIISKHELQNKSCLMAQVDEFRRSSFEIQVNHNHGHYNNYEKLMHFKHENDELLINPLVKNFLETEFKLSKMLASVYNCIAEDIDFDIDFLLH